MFIKRQGEGRGEGKERGTEVTGTAQQQRVEQDYCAMCVGSSRLEKQWMRGWMIKRGMGAGNRTEVRRREEMSTLCTLCLRFSQFTAYLEWWVSLCKGTHNHPCTKKLLLVDSLPRFQKKGSSAHLLNCDHIFVNPVPCGNAYWLSRDEYPTSEKWWKRPLLFLVYFLC